MNISNKRLAASGVTANVGSCFTQIPCVNKVRQLCTKTFWRNFPFQDVLNLLIGKPAFLTGGNTVEPVLYAKHILHPDQW